jgi:hypothetical protein
MGNRTDGLIRKIEEEEEEEEEEENRLRSPLAQFTLV